MQRSAKLHSVSESATAERPGVPIRAGKRALTTQRITAAAQRLADERGLDGFTMDDLAELAQVSRRTLFNYFPSKDDAVLGGPPDLPADLLETFTRGGPHGNLVDDMAELVVHVVTEKRESREEVARGRRVMLGNPRLVALAQTRLRETVESCLELVQRREGAAYDRQRLDVALTLVLACFHVAMDRYLDGDSDDGLADLFAETVRTAHDLLT
jgi:AcrR family transcriptional regulator